MKEKFEEKYQELKEELEGKPWMQVIPHQSVLKQEWSVDRWVAGAFAAYAVERMNGKSEEEAMAYTAKMNRRANLDNPAGPEVQKPIADTPEARAHFEKLVRS